MHKRNVKTWDHLISEEHNQDDRVPLWHAVVDQMSEQKISSAKVLDFGSGKGGFLNALYDAKLFKQGIGVDIACDNLAIANQLRGKRPVHYAHNDELTAHKGSFDYAFSHDFAHLIQDMDEHARDMHDLLTPDGVYYLVTGKYAENPLWPRMYSAEYKNSPIPPQNYSLNDIALSFDRAGFSVAVDRLKCHGFFSYQAGGDRYLQNPLELIKYMTEYMMIFRLEKKV